MGGCRYNGWKWTREDLAIRTVVELKQDILALPDADYPDLCRWIMNHDWEHWEREFDEDVRADGLYGLATQSIKARGELRDL